MFNKFPKKRPVLPKQIEKIYSFHYKQNRDRQTFATSLSQRMEVWMHKEVAKDVLHKNCTKSTLEIGAGTLNQLQYEPVVGPYDIVEPVQNFYECSDLLKRIRSIYSDITEIPNYYKYDRITSMATFEHICNLPETIAKCGLLLKPEGVLRVAIPSEGTLLWTLGWKITTGIEFRIKYGINYGILMRYEHVNNAKEIYELLNYFFRNIKGRVFGLSKCFSFYQFYVCKKPDLLKCYKFLK